MVVIEHFITLSLLKTIHQSLLLIIQVSGEQDGW